MSDPIVAALVAIRWVHFAALYVVFGDALFWRVVAPSSSCPASAVRAASVVRAAAWIAAISGLAWLGTTIVSVTGDLAGIGDRDALHAFFFETSFGPVELGRLALLAALVAAASRSGLVAAVLAAALLVSQAWLGHAAEGGATWRGDAMIAAYGAHMLAGAAWLGSLPALLFAIRELLADGRAALADLLARYSTMAAPAVAVIVASGLANTTFHVHGLDALAHSTYGRVLAAKLTLVAAMLAIAVANRFVAMPRLRQGRTTRGLITAVAAELGVAAGVLAAAALLGVTPPPA